MAKKIKDDPQAKKIAHALETRVIRFAALLHSGQADWNDVLDAADEIFMTCEEISTIIAPDNLFGPNDMLHFENGTATFVPGVLPVRTKN